MSDQEAINNAIAAINHTIAVFRSMAERGDYPIELLPEVNGAPNPAFMGKQGFHYLVEASRGLKAIAGESK